MNSGEFIISLLRITIYALSFTVLIPFVSSGEPTVAVSFLVYAMAKGVDYIEKIIVEEARPFFRWRIIYLAVIFSVVLLGFYQNGGGNDMTFIILVLMGTTCLYDLVETVYVTVQYYRTKESYTRRINE